MCAIHMLDTAHQVGLIMLIPDLCVVSRMEMATAQSIATTPTPEQESQIRFSRVGGGLVQWRDAVTRGGQQTDSTELAVRWVSLTSTRTTGDSQEAILT